jgi:ABC-type antimicrobial peptide transport system permease subunit
MALGASRSSIRQLVLRQGAQVILIGLAVGVALSAVTNRALASFLFGVQKLDPVTLGAVALVMALIGLLATALPVLRATSVDPQVALRYE